MGTKGKARRTPTAERQPTTTRTLTAAAQARQAAMLKCAPIVTQKELLNALVAEGIDLSRATVGYVLHGEFYNADVGRIFCRLVGRSLVDMWPDWVDARGTIRDKRADP